MDADLFNGEYYQQQVQYEGLCDTSFIEMLAGFGDDLSEEQRLLKTEGPKYQYGSGCLSDGVFGAWLARLCGLETRLDREHIRSHLRSVFEHNIMPSLTQHVNVQRPGFALGDEAGLLLCTWPRGGKPTLPFVYSDEVWTGIEYQMASHLIWEGYTDEGLRIVEAVRSRYDGRTRNPWNEYECGSYYARAKASYALLIAYSGFRYTAAEKTLFISPRLPERPFTCFFSTASGWGTFTLTGSQLELNLVEGQLQIDRLHVQGEEQEFIKNIGIIVRAGEPMRLLL